MPLVYAFLMLLLPASAPADTAVTLRVMSFNIRYNNPEDGADAWPHRRDAVARLMASADLVGVQEALPGQITDLEEHLSAFDWFGVGRDSTGGGEYSAIFYRTDRFELLEHDTFWLSPTPNVPGSVGWDAALPRIVTWGRLRDRRTDRDFFYFNTHFDHRGERARQESARLLLRKIEAIAGAASVLVTGDFNGAPESAPYRILTGTLPVEEAPALTDAHEASAAPPIGPNSSWNGFEEVAPGRRIDYVFVGGDVQVLRHTVITTRRQNGRFLSDHLPVAATVAFGK